MSILGIVMIESLLSPAVEPKAEQVVTLQAPVPRTHGPSRNAQMAVLEKSRIC